MSYTKLWQRRLMSPVADTIAGNPVLPWSFKTIFPEECLHWMKEYDYLCLCETNGEFLMVRRDACVNGISSLSYARIARRVLSDERDT